MREFHPTEDASATAEIIVPKLVKMFRPASVVDFGCNVGCWLKAFVDCGVTDVVGIDGDNMLPHLRFTRDQFIAHDLSQPLDLGRKFDLALCLEVGEHLSADGADTLIETITAHSSVVFWSAATPGQGGHQHLNEQPHSYWQEKFAEHGFIGMSLADVLPVVPHDYYRRNAWCFRTI